MESHRDYLEHRLFKYLKKVQLPSGKWRYYYSESKNKDKKKAKRPPNSIRRVNTHEIQEVLSDDSLRIDVSNVVKSLEQDKVILKHKISRGKKFLSKLFG